MPEFVQFDNLGIIDHNSPVPYYFQLTTYIEGKINSKEWVPGHSLPSEQEFCEKLAVSRTVVRQAMANLERKGLITKQTGKRSAVALPKYDGDLMQNLRGFYEDAITRGQKPSTRVLDLKVVPATAEVAESLQLKAGEPVILLNRLRFLDGEPEVLVVTYLPEHLCPLLVNEDFRNQSLYELLARKYGLRIAQGFRTIEAVCASRSDAKLLGVKPGSALLLLKSIGRLTNGTPLEYFTAKHRGDRSKFHVWLRRSAE